MPVAYWKLAQPICSREPRDKDAPKDKEAGPRRKRSWHQGNYGLKKERSQGRDETKDGQLLGSQFPWILQRACFRPPTDLVAHW